MTRSLPVFVLCLAMVVGTADAQQYPGEVSGWLSGVTHKYNGDFSDDSWGAGLMASLQYAPIKRLGIEARVGLGEYRWKIGNADIASHPGYYGLGSQIGDNYPGTLTEIERENESRITTVDLLINYNLVDNIAAIPFISAGVGLVDYAPSTDQVHDPLPNFSTQQYQGSCASIPIGGGVRIPFSYRAGIVLRGEYRFVFSQFLDDVNFNGANDGLTSVSLGFSYRFTNPPRRCMPCLPPHKHKHPHNNCACEAHPDHAIGDCPCARLLEAPGQHDDHEMRGNGQDDTSKPNGKPDSRGSGQQNDANEGGSEVVPESHGTQSKPEQDTVGTGSAKQRSTQPPSTKPAAPTSNESQDQGCPEGLVRECIDKVTGEGICVDPTFKPGPSRIVWEDALIYEQGSSENGKTLRSVGRDNPCYAVVVRQLPSSFYACIDCCFEKQASGSSSIYNPIGTVKIVKGRGTFSPEKCAECGQDSAEGK